MKRVILLLALVMMSNLCFTQATCKLSDLAKKLNLNIEQDEKRPDNNSIISPLTLTIDNKVINKDGKKVHQTFSYNSGYILRFYVLSSNAFDNDATLKLYLRSEDDSIPKIQKASITDKSGDNKPSVLEYKIEQVSDFYLELSLDENTPGCAVAITTIQKTK